MQNDVEIDWREKAFFLAAQLEQAGETIEQATRALEHLNNIKDASVYLLKVMALRGETDCGIFKLSDEDKDKPSARDNIQLLIHAIVTLQSLIEGAPLPPFVFEQGVIH